MSMDLGGVDLVGILDEAYGPVFAELDCLIAEARVRHAEAVLDRERQYECREWFGFRPGWPARRAARLAVMDA